MIKPTLTRRQAITSGLAAVTVTALELPMGAALAQGASPNKDGQHKIGDALISVVSDGGMQVSTDRVIGKAPADLAKAMTERLAVTNGATFAVNVCLVESGGKRTLIDAGAGGNWVPTAGKLVDNLARIGVEPNSIDLVILTHAHADHLWGVIDDLDDSLRFPKARYAIPEIEFDFWSGSKAASTAGVNEGVAAGARRVLKSLEPKLTRYKPDTEIAPGIIMIDAGGHTPGQCAALITSGGAAWLTTADTLFHSVVSIEHPEWQPAQDMDGERAVATRRRLLDLAVSEKALVSAYHIAQGPGRIEKRGAGYVWAPAEASSTK
jgi:glyoxylase-like metal-dependent hydrolase (beta-lactamase superfamily II)